MEAQLKRIHSDSIDTEQLATSSQEQKGANHKLAITNHSQSTANCQLQKTKHEQAAIEGRLRRTKDYLSQTSKDLT